MYKFSVGDRVRIKQMGTENIHFNEEKNSPKFIKFVDDNRTKNIYGTIVYCKTKLDINNYAIIFDEYCGGHSFTGKPFQCESGHGQWLDEDEIEKIDNFLNKGECDMNLITKFQNLFISEPEKTFRVVGITNNNDILTDDGQKIFLSWLLKKNGDEFKSEVVDELLKEKEKD